MDESLLNQWKNHLADTPARPRAFSELPLLVVVRQGRRLVAALERPPVRDQLRAVGLTFPLIRQLRERLEVLHELQRQWGQTAQRETGRNVIHLEERAHQLCSELWAAARYALRREIDRLEPILDARRADTPERLAAELERLAAAARDAPAAFVALGLNPHAKADEAHHLARAIRQAVAAVSASPSAARLWELRNRARVAVQEVLDEVREAARYAYRDSPVPLGPLAPYYRLLVPPGAEPLPGAASSAAPEARADHSALPR